VIIKNHQQSSKIIKHHQKSSKIIKTKDQTPFFWKLGAFTEVPGKALVDLMKFLQALAAPGSVETVVVLIFKPKVLILSCPVFLVN